MRASGASLEAYIVTMPGSPVRSVAAVKSSESARVGGLDVLGHAVRLLLGLGDQQVVAAERQTGARGLLVRRTGAALDLPEAGLRLRLVRDLQHHQRQRALLGVGYGGHGDAVTDPGLDVAGVVEVGAVAALDDLLEDRPAQVVAVAELELLLQRRELAQDLERLDLLRRRRVEVEADVADRVRGHRRRRRAAAGHQLRRRRRHPRRPPRRPPRPPPRPGRCGVGDPAGSCRPGPRRRWRRRAGLRRGTRAPVPGRSWSSCRPPGSAAPDPDRSVPGDQPNGTRGSVQRTREHRREGPRPRPPRPPRPGSRCSRAPSRAAPPGHRRGPRPARRGRP